MAPEADRQVRHKRLRIALIGGLAAVGLLVLWHYFSVMLVARDVLAGGARIAATVRDLDPGTFDRTAVTGMQLDVAGLRQRVTDLRSFSAGDPLVGLVRASVLADQVAAGDVALAAADDLGAAAEIAVGLADRLVSLREAGGQRSMFVGLIDLMGSTRDEVGQLEARLDAAEARIDGLPPGAWSGFERVLNGMTEPVGKYRPLLDDYQRMAAVLPDAFGWRTSKRYLVLAQNPAELRPTGGYSGTVGAVTFRPDGPPEPRFVDVYTIDLLPGAPYVEPPPELQEHLLGSQSWKLADANWSPDFPTSARTALRLTSLQTGMPEADGVIALNTYALDKALEVLGPVEVPEFEVTVASGEVTMTALRLTRGVSGPNSQRKSFLNYLAEAIITRIQALPQDRWLPMLEAFRQMADEHMVLLYFSDPAAQEVIHGTPLAGEVRQDPGDYLYVVESNMAPTSKYNLVVTRSSRLSVAIDDSGNASTRLGLEWQNDAGLPGEPYSLLREYSTNKVGAYGAYVRLLVPRAATVTSAEGEGFFPVNGISYPGQESGRQVFGNYLLMAPGRSHMDYAWTTPRVARAKADGRWEYNLTIEKQPGARAEEVTLELTLPEGAEVTSLPRGAREEQGVVHWSTTLTRDVQIEVEYRLP